MPQSRWQRLFPGEGFRWSMNLGPGDAAEFFAPSLSNRSLATRRSLLESSPQHYALIPDSGDTLHGEALATLGEWSGRRFDSLLDAGAELEPDWIFLKPDLEGRFRIEGGVVCFPSGWSLPEKRGLTVKAVHETVPGLNEALSRRIDTFLSRLAPGAAWERENWGLSADDELDHHPRLRLGQLLGTEPLSKVWIRLERQLFSRLRGGGILFGIRVSNHRLDEVVANEGGIAKRIAHALQTMPEDVAEYKGVASAREGLVETLLNLPPRR